MVGAPLAVEQVVVGEAVDLVVAAAAGDRVAVGAPQDRSACAEPIAFSTSSARSNSAVGPSLKLELLVSETLTAAFEVL